MNDWWKAWICYSASETLMNGHKIDPSTINADELILHIIPGICFFIAFIIYGFKYFRDE